MFKNKNKKFKALILDVDGTIIPNRPDGLPSKKIIETIALASKKIHIGVATSRPLFVLLPILKHLPLSGPSIINGGAQIVNFPSKEILWEKAIKIDNFQRIVKILVKINKRFITVDEDKDVEYVENYLPKKPLQVWIHNLSSEEAEDVISKLTIIPDITIHKVPSWAGDDRRELVVNHALATKQHGIFEVARILNIDTKEMIGVGDGYNDFPLLMACGLKVAMGNAVPEIKEIADYIAPKVEDDGVADVIERFVL